MKKHEFIQTTIYECEQCFSFQEVETECNHTLVVIDFIISGGGHQFWNVCTTCLRKLGNPLSQKNTISYAQRNLEDFNKTVFEKSGESKIKELRATLLQKQRDLMASDYKEYLNSPEWKEKRRRILKRDNYKCGICNKEAVDVHHLTYAHFKNEYDFELIALCRTCHVEEYHSSKAEKVIEKVKTEKAFLNSKDNLT